jgi:3-deoxy-D-manno-octulosonate 8-phosphate phosphatase (KDO 8-P phosphatase)
MTAAPPDIPAELARRLQRLRLVAFDFDGVFTDNAVFVLEDGREAVRCSRFDGIGLRRLEASGVEAVILSAEVNTVVLARARKLRIAARNGLEDKHAALMEEIERRGLTPEQVAYVGNDLNDAECLAAVGLPIVVGDAHPEVLDLGFYRTRWLGGHGAVREICDLVFHAKRAAKNGEASP